MAIIGKLERHPLSAAFGTMGEADRLALKQSLKEDHREVEIVTLDGLILDGWHRAKCLEALGIDLAPYMREYAGDDPVGYVLRMNERRRHISKLERVRALILVYRWREANGGARVPPVREIARVSGVSKSLANDAERALDDPGFVQKMDKKKKRRVNVTGDFEWYTPPELLEAGGQAVGGGFDLDPASCDRAQEQVKAGRHFTIEDDALREDADWTAERVWLNPPYASKPILAFIKRLIAEREAGRVKRAVTLTPCASARRWARLLLDKADAVCFINEQPRFYREEQGDDVPHPMTGYMVCGMGVDPVKFRAAFGSMGQVYFNGGSEAGNGADLSFEDMTWRMKAEKADRDRARAEAEAKELRVQLRQTERRLAEQVAA